MTYEKPDGRIEIESSGCCCPPGEKRAGQHTNSGTTWWRITHGVPMTEWVKLPHGSSNALAIASKAKTCREFVEAMP